MITVNIDPVAFSIGPLTVRWYGLMYIVGIVVGLLAAWPYARSRDIPQEKLEKLVLWSIPFGFIGARLYYVLQQPLGQYLHHPLDIVAVWQGGMAFYGAIFAVVIVMIILAWRDKMSVWTMLDVGAIFAVVGQFFGRIGNFINGDVIGYPTNLPWGVVYKNPNSFAPRHDIAYQPAAAYEALFNIVLFAVLWRIRKRFSAGMVFFVYIVGYSLGQLLLFIRRDNTVIIAGLKQAQLTAIGVIVAAAAVYLLVYRRLRKPPAPAHPAE